MWFVFTIFTTSAAIVPVLQDPLPIDVIQEIIKQANTFYDVGYTHT